MGGYRVSECSMLVCSAPREKAQRENANHTGNDGPGIPPCFQRRPVTRGGEKRRVGGDVIKDMKAEFKTFLISDHTPMQATLRSMKFVP